MEGEKIHALLQSSVDREIQKKGYLPSPQPEPVPTSSNNGNSYHRPQQHGQRQVRISIRSEQWKCSPKQQEWILRIVRENSGDKDRVEQLSQELFGVGVKQLKKLQASVPSSLQCLPFIPWFKFPFTQNPTLHSPLRSLKYTHDHEQPFVVTRPGSFGSSRTESE